MVCLGRASRGGPSSKHVSCYQECTQEALRRFAGCWLSYACDHEPDLQTRLMNTKAYDMIRQLRDMFQTQARTERYDATKAFNECKMIKGTSVSDHVMKMKRHIDHLERLGHPVPLQLATDTILNSLPEDYKPFVVNYNMNNMEKSIAELHSMLKTAELNMGTKSKTKDVLLVKDGGVKKKHGNGGISKGKGLVQAVQSAPKVRKNGKGKGKGKKVKPNKARTENRCFTCNEVGHWRQNCPKRHEAECNMDYTKLVSLNAFIFCIYDQSLNNSYKRCRPKTAQIFDRVANIGRDPRLRLLLGNCHKKISQWLSLSPEEMYYHLSGYKSSCNLVNLSACLGVSLGPCDQDVRIEIHSVSCVSSVRGSHKNPTRTAVAAHLPANSSLPGPPIHHRIGLLHVAAPVGPSQQSNRQAQANLAKVNPLEASKLDAAFSATTLEPNDDQWYMDSGATSHLTADAGKFIPLVCRLLNMRLLVMVIRYQFLDQDILYYPTPPNLFTLKTSYTHLMLSKTLCLYENFFVIISFLLNLTHLELKTGKHLARHNSSGDLYPFTNQANAPALSFSVSSSLPIWHFRLGHPGHYVMDFLHFNKHISCNKVDKSFVCQSCQIAKHKRLPFKDSTSTTLKPLDLVHADLWTSPIPSNTSYNYYLVIIDDFTHFTWCNKGGEFDNHQFHSFASTTGLHIRFSCPHISQQNGTTRRMICRLNELMISFLTHASLPPSFWVDALHTATYLHNILPTKLLHNRNPTSVLYLKHPTYDHLRIFGCACYPNLNATRPHKLAPRFTTCVFLGYPPQYRGYRCLDLSTGKVILSRYVTIDESLFPYANINQNPPTQPFYDSDPNPLLFHPTSTPPPHPPINTPPPPPPINTPPTSTAPASTTGATSHPVPTIP
ncbi:hypothetical protein OSB04_024026 [Centaurea solstitialis]|uniref:Polyprotein n=1 Tax=Centaurea solstitialis TaxID=347529 RepID=A0AA38SKB3_9ASTR|nr:hypothetical protein OSB04_024026 [Centaurea solstitialis]